MDESGGLAPDPAGLGLADADGEADVGRAPAVDGADTQIQAAGDVGGPFVERLVGLGLPQQPPLTAGNGELQAGRGALASNAAHLLVESAGGPRVVESHGQSHLRPLRQ